MPLPNIRMIPRGWSKHHQPVVLGSHNATCQVVSKIVPGVWDDQAGTYGPPQILKPFGPQSCRLQRIKDGRKVDQAEVDVFWREYMISLPADLPDIEVGWLIRIEQAPNDPLAEGQYFDVTDIYLGSELWERNLVTTHNQNLSKQ